MQLTNRCSDGKLRLQQQGSVNISKRKNDESMPLQPDSEYTSKRKKSVTLNDYGENVCWKIGDTACDVLKVRKTLGRTAIAFRSMLDRFSVAFISKLINGGGDEQMFRREATSLRDGSDKEAEKPSRQCYARQS